MDGSTSGSTSGSTTGTTTGMVLALGDPALLAGYALAGAAVVAARAADDVVRAWDAVPPDVALIVLTSDAAAALGPRRDVPGACLTVVIPG